MKTIEGCISLAQANNALTSFSPSPTYHNNSDKAQLPGCKLTVIPWVDDYL